MDDRIALQTIFITIMIDISIYSISIHPKVANAKRLKQQSKCLQIIDKIFRTKTQRSNSN